MNVDERVRTELRDHADQVHVRMPPVDQVIAHRQRRPLGTAITVATVLVAVVALAMWTTRLVPGLDVVDTPPGGGAVTVVDVRLLDGTHLQLALPAEVVADATVQRWWAGSLYAAASLDQIDTATPAWRLDVRRGTLDDELPDGQPVDLPDTARADHARWQPGSRLGLAFGPWIAIISGDSRTADHLDLLLDSVELTETSTGDVEYTGSMVLWQVDSPELRLDGSTTAISVFLRRCPDPATTYTASGLGIVRIDDPNRGRHLTMLCSDEIPLEVWLETPQPLDDTALTHAEMDVITSGSILTAIRADQTPGSTPDPSPGRN